MELTVMSFNVKRDFGKVRKQNLWQNRSNNVAALIDEVDAQIVGLQEVLPYMKDDLQPLLNHYAFLGHGRYFNLKPKQDEHTNILIKDKQLSIENAQTFWLSKYPSKIASRFLSSIFPRICTLAHVNYQGQKIRVLNTHLDHLSAFARNASVDLIIDTIKRLNEQEDLPTIVMGDFNTGRSSKCIKKLSTYLSDVYNFSTKEVTNTIHHYSGKQKANKSPIDFIFVSHHFEVMDVEILAKDYNGLYPSDHFPIVAKLKLKS